MRACPNATTVPQCVSQEPTAWSAAIATSSLLFMPFFPRQKDDIARLKQLPPSPWMGTCTIALLALLMIFGTVFACLPIIPATSCLLIAGGSGCS